MEQSQKSRRLLGERLVAHQRAALASVKVHVVKSVARPVPGPTGIIGGTIGGAFSPHGHYLSRTLGGTILPQIRAAFRTADAREGLDGVQLNQLYARIQVLLQ
jgi:hypothetical protein